MNAITRVTQCWPVHARFDGPIVMIGFGSIGRGTLPLIERHIGFDRSKFVVIAPDDQNRDLLDGRRLRFINAAVRKENLRDLLAPLLTGGPGRGMIINLSVDTSSVELMEFAKDIDAFYLDTWLSPGRASIPIVRSHPRRVRTTRCAKASSTCAVAGPAGLPPLAAAAPIRAWWRGWSSRLCSTLQRDLDIAPDEPRSREAWGQLMRRVGVKGIHIAERDTPRARVPRPRGQFVNTWSVEGFVAEGLQPSELGWGTHEKSLPPGGHHHDFGCDAAIYLTRPGAGTRVRSWTPTAQAQHGWMITHNESISIADYFTLREGGEVVYRPTCHYAYHPCDDAVLSLHEMAGAQWKPQNRWHVLSEDEIVDGVDELGVLLYGHARNAYWYGSQLSIEETRALAPYQNATGLQVTSAVLAGVVWMLENPDRGIVEADEMDFRRCLEIQRPYLGKVIGRYTEWTPAQGRGELFPESVDRADPWQFSNVLVA
jgi:homospermidine synthase